MQGMIDVNDYEAVRRWDAVRDELRAALESTDAWRGHRIGSRCLRSR